MALPDGSPEDVLDLLDWKRGVFDLYGEARRREPAEAWSLWRNGRDDLFRRHPQSPLTEEQRSSFRELAYYDYDPSARCAALLEPAEAESYEIPTSGDETMAFTRFATARFELGGESCSLEVYWLDAYGGGIFLPFRDETSGNETYGAGRYLLDTVKGADLGVDERGRLILDFNFAYNPSCAYDPRWVCPLAPPPNRLRLPVRAGEKTPGA